MYIQITIMPVIRMVATTTLRSTRLRVCENAVKSLHRTNQVLTNHLFGTGAFTDNHDGQGAGLINHA